MANLEEIVSRKTENDSQWKARQQADRENLMALQDAAVMEITSSPEAYSHYLDLQGDNPAYSAGNIALAMVQDGDVTVFGTKEKWKMLGRFVPVSENGNAYISSPGLPSARVHAGGCLRCATDPGADYEGGEAGK